MSQIFYLITFESTHQAIHYEKLLKDQFAIELIPTPREISASCGLSLRFETEDFMAISATIEDADKEKLKLYEWIRDGQVRRAVEMSWR